MKKAEKDKLKWQKTLRSDLMSSEESCSGDDDVYVKTIPWRAETVNVEIDSRHENSASSQTEND